MPGFPTLTELIEYLAFLGEEPAALGLLVTAILLVVLRDWRWSLLALAIQYVLVGWLLTGVLEPQVAMLKILVGMLICVVLYLTARQIDWKLGPRHRRRVGRGVSSDSRGDTNDAAAVEAADALPAEETGETPDEEAEPQEGVSEPGAHPNEEPDDEEQEPEDSEIELDDEDALPSPLPAEQPVMLAVEPTGWKPLATSFTFRLLISLLIAIVVLYSARSGAISLPELQDSINMAALALMALGLLATGLTEEPLAAGEGLLTTMAGFGLLYHSLEQSVLVVGLIIVIDFVIAIITSYLAIARHLTPEAAARRPQT